MRMRWVLLGIVCFAAGLAAAGTPATMPSIAELKAAIGGPAGLPPELSPEAPESVRKYYEKAFPLNEFDVAAIVKALADVQREKSVLKEMQEGAADAVGKRAGRVAGKWIFPSEEVKEAMIKKEAENLAPLEHEVWRIRVLPEQQPADIKIVSPYGRTSADADGLPLKIGCIGSYPWIRLKKILSETQAIAVLLIPEEGDTAESRRLLLNYPTKGHADGDTIEASQVWEITGVKKVGSETIFELNPFDFSKYLVHPAASASATAVAPGK